MKVTVTFKCPNACDYAIEQILDGMEFTEPYEREDKKTELEKKFSKLFRYGEYVDIEVDLETMTKRVL